MTSVPWDFSDAGSGPRTVPNLPTEDGAALGREMARLFDAEKDAPERCHDCAFRLGTTPNQSAPTLMDALKCVMEGVPFNCHVEEKPCAGYVAFRRAGGAQ